MRYCDEGSLKRQGCHWIVSIRLLWIAFVGSPSSDRPIAWSEYASRTLSAVLSDSLHGPSRRSARQRPLDRLFHGIQWILLLPILYPDSPALRKLVCRHVSDDIYPTIKLASEIAQTTQRRAKKSKEELKSFQFKLAFDAASSRTIFHTEADFTECILKM